MTRAAYEEEPSEPDVRARRPRRAAARPLDTPAPVAPLILGVAASLLVFLLWTVIGLPLIGLVGAVFSGTTVCGLLLWRRRPLPPVEDDTPGWTDRG